MVNMIENLMMIHEQYYIRLDIGYWILDIGYWMEDGLIKHPNSFLICM